MRGMSRWRVWAPARPVSMVASGTDLRPGTVPGGWPAARFAARPRRVTGVPSNWSQPGGLSTSRCGGHWRTAASSWSPPWTTTSCCVSSIFAVALSGRRYATEGSLVLDVADDFCPWNEGRWLLEGGPDGSECRRARGQGRASLRLDSSVLGSLFLGGASVWRLAKVGRISADLMSLRCAHQMFGADLDPWCSTEF